MRLSLSSQDRVRSRSGVISSGMTWKSSSACMKKEKKEKNRNSLVAIKFLFSNNRAPQLMRLSGCRDDNMVVVIIIMMMMMAMTRQG